MIRILITLPNTFGREVAILESYAEKFQKIHLRKEDWTEEQTIRFLDTLSHKLIRRIVLCDHYHLALDYNVGGIHMKESKRTMNIGASGKGTVSTSFHDLHTLKKEAPAFDYALFGPVYPSFSKSGYVPAYTKDDFRKALSQTKARVVGIGGITDNKTGELQSLGFSGLAFYTSFWKDHVKA